jgi:hypothetical protein
LIEASKSRDRARIRPVGSNTAPGWSVHPHTTATAPTHTHHTHTCTHGRGLTRRTHLVHVRPRGALDEVAHQGQRPSHDAEHQRCAGFEVGQVQPLRLGLHERSHKGLVPAEDGVVDLVHFTRVYESIVVFGERGQTCIIVMMDTGRAAGCWAWVPSCDTYVLRTRSSSQRPSIDSIGAKAQAKKNTAAVRCMH